MQFLNFKCSEMTLKFFFAERFLLVFFVYVGEEGNVNNLTVFHTVSVCETDSNALWIRFLLVEPAYKLCDLFLWYF